MTILKLHIRDSMKGKYNISGAAVVILVLLALLSGCTKPDDTQIKEPVSDEQLTDEPLCTYMFDGEEIPVHSVDRVTSETQLMMKVSPLKEGEKQTTYALIGINASLEGVAVDVSKAWNNDDYYFIYEDPVVYYSQYRRLESGTILIRKKGEKMEVHVDVILPDGKEFKIDYKE